MLKPNPVRRGAILCGLILVALLVPVSALAQSATGVLSAADFSHWTVYPNAGTLNWSDPSTCRPAAVGGTIFTAFTVGSPVRINDSNPGNSETASPTQVTFSGAGCSINLPMTKSHTSYSIGTATAGLQEAINYSVGLGNQTAIVEVTPAWTLAGGTTAMLTAAIGNANVSILDMRTAVLSAYTWTNGAYVQQTFGGGTIASVKGAAYPQGSPLSYALAGTASNPVLQYTLAVSGNGATVLTTTGAAGTSTNCATFDGQGNVVPFTSGCGGQGGTPGGGSNQVQFANSAANAFAGDATFLFNPATRVLTTPATISSIGTQFNGYQGNTPRALYDPLDPQYAGGLTAAQSPAQQLATWIAVGQKASCDIAQGKETSAEIIFPASIPLTFSASAPLYANIRYTCSANDAIGGCSAALSGGGDAVFYTAGLSTYACNGNATYMPTGANARIDHFTINGGNSNNPLDRGINVYDQHVVVENNNFGTGLAFGGAAIYNTGTDNYIEHNYVQNANLYYWSNNHRVLNYFTASTTAGSTVITVTGTFPSNIFNGQAIQGTNYIVQGAKIVSFNSTANTITLSSAPGTTATGVQFIAGAPIGAIECFGTDEYCSENEVTDGSGLANNHALTGGDVTASITAGSTTITVTSATFPSGIAVGQNITAVAGVGYIPFNATVTAFNAGAKTITASVAAAQTVPGLELMIGDYQSMACLDVSGGNDKAANNLLQLCNIGLRVEVNSSNFQGTLNRYDGMSGAAFVDQGVTSSNLQSLLSYDCLDPASSNCGLTREDGAMSSLVSGTTYGIANGQFGSSNFTCEFENSAFGSVYSANSLIAGKTYCGAGVLAENTLNANASTAIDNNLLTTTAGASGGAPNVNDYSAVSFTDSTPVSIYTFHGMALGQRLEVYGGNSNVTIVPGSTSVFGQLKILTCDGNPVVLGNIQGSVVFIANNNSINEQCAASTSSGTLTGQTVNGIPLATSAGGSTRSSSLSDANGIVQTTEPFASAGYQGIGPANTGNAGWGYTVGTGGITANNLVNFSGGQPVAVTSATQYQGIAQNTVAAGSVAQIITLGIGTIVMDGSTTIGDLCVPSTTNLGECHDSGQTAFTAIPCATPVVGVINSAVASGAVGSVRLFQPGTYGLSCSASTPAYATVTGTGAAAASQGQINYSGVLTSMESFGSSTSVCGNLNLVGATSDGTTTVDYFMQAVCGGNITFNNPVQAPRFAALGSVNANGNFQLSATNATPPIPGTGIVEIAAPNAVTTPYNFQLPGAPPSTGNTFLSCSASQQSVCSWVSGGTAPPYTSSTTAGAASASNLQTTFSGGVGFVQSYGASTSACGNLDLVGLTSDGTSTVDYFMQAVCGGSITFNNAVIAPKYNAVGSGGAYNGQYLLTSVGTLPAVPGANVIGITAPNTVTTPYNFALPGAPPASSTATFLSCTNAATPICSWAAASGGGLPTGTTGQGLYYAAGGTTVTPTSDIVHTGATAGSPLGFNQASPLDMFEFVGQELHTGAGPSSPTNMTGTTTSTATTINVTSTTGYPPSGYLLIGSSSYTGGEFVSYSGTTSTSFTGVTRGLFGSTASAQTTGNVQLLTNILADSKTSNPAYIKVYNGQLIFSPDTIISNNVGQGSAIAFGGSSIAAQGFSMGGTSQITNDNAGLYGFNFVNGSSTSVGKLNGAGLMTTTGNSVYLTTATTITATSATTTGLVMPSIPISTTVHGTCSIIYEQSTAAAAVTFSVAASAAPTNLWAMNSIYNGTALAQQYTSITSTTNTPITGSTVPAAAATAYREEVDFTLKTGATNAVVLTLYGLTSNASDALVIEPGSTCGWSL